MNLDTETKKELSSWFDCFDKDSSGFLGPSELKQLLDSIFKREATEVELQAALENFEASETKRISKEIFTAHIFDDIKTTKRKRNHDETDKQKIAKEMKDFFHKFKRDKPEDRADVSEFIFMRQTSIVNVDDHFDRGKFHIT